MAVYQLECSKWIQYAILAMVQSIRKDSIKQGTGHRSIISQNKSNMHRWERIEKQDTGIVNIDGMSRKMYVLCQTGWKRMPDLPRLEMISGLQTESKVS